MKGAFGSNIRCSAIHRGQLCNESPARYLATTITSSDMPNGFVIKSSHPASSGHGLENDGVFGLADDHSGLSAVL
jgi:hypothetical protein